MKGPLPNLVRHWAPQPPHVVMFDVVCTAPVGRIVRDDFNYLHSL
jgi:hypothetical protein